MLRAFCQAVFVYVLVGAGCAAWGMPSAVFAQAGSQMTIGIEVFSVDVTAPTVPQNLSNTVIPSVPQVTLNWDASTDAHSGVAYYNVYRDDLGWIASTTNTTYIDLNVLVGSTYTYNVSAVDNESNESAQSNPTIAQVNPPSSGGGGSDSTPPTVPTNLIAQVDADEPSVTLTWNPSTDTQSSVAHYRIYRDGAYINTSVIPNYTDYNVALGSTYTYRVSAVDTSGNQSAQSDPALAIVPSGATPDTTPPSVPQNVQAVGAPTPSATVTWEPSSDAESGVSHYNISRNGTFIASTTALTYVDTTVSVGVLYAYQISAVDNAGNESEESSPASVTITLPDTTPPSVPQNLLATLLTGPSVGLSWNASTDGQSGIGFYRIYRDGVLLGSSPTTAYTDTTVSPDTTYTYRVSAVDGAGNESAQSSGVSIAIPAVPVTEPEPEPEPTTPDPGPSDPEPTDPEDPTTPSTPSTPSRPDPRPPIPSEEPIVPSPSGPGIGTIARDLFSQTTDRGRAFISEITDALSQGAAPVSRWAKEEPEQQRIVAVGTAVTGLIIPVIEFGVIPFVTGSSFWYALLTRLRDFWQFLSWLFSWLGIRKRRRPWGTVYDSVTKQPLDPAYVELIDTSSGESVASAITDLDGRYGFSPTSGVYRMVANKTNYQFPSARVAHAREDAMYNNLYFGDPITTQEDTTQIVAYDIPMDPTTFDWNEFEKRRLGVMRFYSSYSLTIHVLTKLLFYVGFAFSVVVLFLHPTWVNAGVAVVYALIMVLRRIYLNPLTSGRVYDTATDLPLSFATVSVYSPANPERPVKKVVTDAFGRYYCLVPPDEYYVIIEEQMRDGSSRPIYQSDLLYARKGLIDEKFKV